MLPLVALVGRPNVGKSTLFNALTRTRDALVHDEPGVTRDRNYGTCRLDADNPFLIVDTGGIAGEEEGLAGATARQSRAAAAEADLILFVVDGREGPSALDDEILAWLRKLSRPTMLLINKVDGMDASAARAEFARYGFSEMLAVSAAHRQGMDDLVEEALRSAALWDEVKDKLKQSAFGLSGGQQQRLCIARTIATRPDVILMDEPCSALDPIATSRIEELMLELKDDYTIIIVTHNMQQAARVSDRTAFFTARPDETTGNRTGVLVEADVTSRIFSAPRDQRTADYVAGRFG